MKTLNEKGFSLLEVMISSFIIAVGILGLAAMQSIALKSSLEVQQRSLADSLLLDIVERMELNHIWLADELNNYKVESVVDYSVTTPTCGATLSCSDADLKINDLLEWKSKLLAAHVTGDSHGLIGADGCIDADDDGNITVVLSWTSTTGIADATASFPSGDFRKTCGVASNNRHQISAVVYIPKTGGVSS